MNKRATLIVITAVVAFVVAFTLSSITSAAGFRSGNMTWTYAILGMSLAAVGGAIWLGLRNNRKVATASDGEKQAILSTPPAPGMARLIVYRDGFVGKMAGVDILLGDAVVAQLKAPRFTALDLPPGAHILGAMVQNKTHGPLPVALAPGEVAIVHIVMSIGGLTLTQEHDLAAARAKLAGMPMVRPDGAGVFA